MLFSERFRRVRRRSFFCVNMRIGGPEGIGACSFLTYFQTIA